ncbi:GcrA family cell cycle regulator [Martelella mediterranea]|uniref:GcrA cell cycle regulator n=1 Tax=Martelella mediterranea TaxID=293089 RepID=A0A4R3NP17_9HYPH|nr:GcrA family cell cycle regulator [Martelella mediterranea]TCT37274.1 hypothetical protein EDC90_101911 [Martelella mediterranea]
MSVWTEAKIDRAVAMKRNGATNAEVAKAFGINRSAVSGMIRRNRSRFPAQRATESKAPQAGFWTEERVRRAVSLWRAGEPNTVIAETIGSHRLTVGRFIAAHPELFPERGEAAPARERPTVVKNSARLADLGVKARPEARAGSKRDLSGLHAPDEQPVSILDAGRRQCRFPLVAFDAAPSADMPCCGAETLEGSSWCAFHFRIVFPGRAAP